MTSPDGAPPLPRVTAVTDRGLALVIICVVFSALATICVVLRMVSRKMKRMDLEWKWVSIDSKWLVRCSDFKQRLLDRGSISERHSTIDYDQQTGHAI